VLKLIYSKSIIYTYLHHQRHTRVDLNHKFSDKSILKLLNSINKYTNTSIWQHKQQDTGVVRARAHLGEVGSVVTHHRPECNSPYCRLLIFDSTRYSAVCLYLTVLVTILDTTTPFDVDNQVCCYIKKIFNRNDPRNFH